MAPFPCISPLLVLAVALLGTSCATAARLAASPVVNAIASASAAIQLAGGSLATQTVTRGPGPFYVSFVELRAPVTASEEEAGFVIVMNDSAEVRVGDGAARAVVAGQAVPLAARARWELRGTADTKAWLVSVRPSTRRGEQSPPAESRVYETPDFPSAPLPAGAYSDELVLLALAPGRELQPHSHGGIEAMLALGGRLDLRVKGKPVHVLVAREGDAVEPDTALAGQSTGTETSYSLVLLATPAGKAVQSPAQAP